jgi:hypothetical protein
VREKKKKSRGMAAAFHALSLLPFDPETASKTSVRLRNAKVSDVPRYLLDTDTCVNIRSKRSARVLERFERLQGARLRSRSSRMANWSMASRRVVGVQPRWRRMKQL